MKMALQLWVWEDVLSDYSRGMVLALAPDEATAWQALKDTDHTAWWIIRGKPDNQDDPRTPEEIPPAIRPRLVTESEAFVIWGGD